MGSGLKTFKVSYKFLGRIHSVDIVAFTYSEARKIFIKEYGLSNEHIVRVVDYKDIEKRNMEKFGGMQK